MILLLFHVFALRKTFIYLPAFFTSAHTCRVPPQRLNKLSRTNTPYLFKPIEIIYVCVGRIGRLSSVAKKVGYKNLEIAFAQSSKKTDIRPRIRRLISISRDQVLVAIGGNSGKPHHNKGWQQIKK